MNYPTHKTENKISKYFNLKKYINFLELYPRLQNLSKINNKFTRSLLIKYYFNLVSKNKNLQKFFLKSSPDISNINFDINDLFNNNKVFDSLASNGIVILENVLEIDEKNKILNFFSEIEDNKIKTKWENEKIIDASSIKYGGSDKVKISYMQKKLEDLPGLSKIINESTTRIFGKKISSVAEFFFHNCYEKEDSYTYDDTNFHIDRYLPCLKIIYTPKEIDLSNAPFGFIKKTHKLTNNFMKEFILNSKSFSLGDDQLNDELRKNIVKVICPDNSLIITFTNGLHKRNIFLKKNSRKTIFFQFTKNFNFFSLLDHKNYN